MATPDIQSEGTISVPSKLLSQSSGLALDIGGSIAKIVYRPKEKSKDGSSSEENNSGGSFGLLETAMFPADEVDEIVEFIFSKCDLKTDTDGNIIVQATGIGSNKHKEKLEKELGIKIKVLEEFECFVNAFQHMMKNSPWSQLVHPQSKAAQSAGEKIAKSYQEWAEKLGMQTDSAGKEENSSENSVKLPAILAMCGSATVLILVNKDGSHRIVDGINAGGRFFIGAANCLVGETDYKSLISMASKGSGRSVDTYYSDLLQDKAGEGVYQVDDDDKLVYPFGKLSKVKKEDVEPNDLVYSLSNIVGTVHAQVIQLNALVHNVKHVYFCGNNFGTEKAREAVESIHIVRSYLAPKDKKVGFHFLRNGGVYGALGAYLHTETPIDEGAAGRPTGKNPESVPLVAQSTHF